MKHRLIVLLTLVLTIMLGSNRLNATHYRAGEISYVQLSDLKIRATLTTYTKTSSISADSDSIIIDWGDGFKQMVARQNFGGTKLANDVKISYFVAEHSYPGRATYTISFSDPNRTANILNINWPNSVEIPFYLSTTFTLLDTQFQGKNSSVVLLQAPIDIACVDQTFIHNPNAYDPDGDSLTYELVQPLASRGKEVPFYKLPSEVAPGFNNQIFLNSKTGDFIWETPQIQGEYNIAIRINEYRSGVLINSMMRDMQIIVGPCINKPPVIESDHEICVIAGEEVVIPLTISDPDSNQLVLLEATGGVFNLGVNKAELDVNPIYTTPPFNAIFKWQTSCNDIKKENYQVVFRAVDNYYNTTGLATLKTITIKVVGPPPILSQVSVKDQQIHLEWDSPYVCEDTNDGFFQGFSVWKKEGAGLLSLDSCTIGIGESAYTKIKAITLDKDEQHYYFDDTDVEPHKSYCYRILAEFANLSSVGYPYNPVSSLRSNEGCATLSGNVPTIIQTSVETTSNNNGSINIKWIPPSNELLDTNEYKGAYKYELLRSIYGNNDFELIPSATTTDHIILDSKEYKYTDTGINTRDSQYEYRVDFYYEENTFFESSSRASSIFLSITPTDKSLKLNWNSFSPWINYKYHIYKYDASAGGFQLIDSTTQNHYMDYNLENGQEYCYKIKAFGNYNDGIRQLSTIRNFSQENCAIPIDNKPPCPPFLKVESICDKEDLDITIEALFNYLYWTNPNINCPSDQDINIYNIYYKNSISGTFELVHSILNSEERNYDHYPKNTLAGCYVITAVDQYGNESNYSNEICVDNCPLYELPNTFTPNGDGHNDIFIPRKNYFIASIDFRLYNRWGTMIYHTTDPQINWDGNTAKGKPMSPGGYTYICKVFESRIDQTSQRNFEINGVIHLIREQ